MPQFPPRTLPEDLLTIICDHYADQRQLRALATMTLLSRRIAAYARTRLYQRFDFVDDRSSRVLGNANDLVEVYEDGEKLDEDILAVVDSKEIDALDLDPPLRWLRGMRTCEVIHVKDLLYGRDIESIITLATSFSKRGLVLFPNVRDMILTSQMIKKIMATESRRPVIKLTPTDLLVALFLATRPTSLCIQDSVLFTSPSERRRRVPSRGEMINGRRLPDRRAHISPVVSDWIEGMDSLQEITYHRVDPNIPIFPKKGAKNIIHFLPMPTPPPYSHPIAGPSTTPISTPETGPSTHPFSLAGYTSATGTSSSTNTSNSLAQAPTWTAISGFYSTTTMNTSGTPIITIHGAPAPVPHTIGVGATGALFGNPAQGHIGGGGLFGGPNGTGVHSMFGGTPDARNDDEDENEGEEVSYVRKIIFAIKDIIKKSVVPISELGLPPPFDNVDGEGDSDGSRDASAIAGLFTNTIPVPNNAIPNSGSNNTAPVEAEEEEEGGRQIRRQTTYHFVLPFGRQCPEKEEIETGIRSWDPPQSHLGGLRIDEIEIEYGLIGEENLGG